MRGRAGTHHDQGESRSGHPREDVWIINGENIDECKGRRDTKALHNLIEDSWVCLEREEGLFIEPAVLDGARHSAENMSELFDDCGEKQPLKKC